MFNADFFPTPEEVINQMLFGIDLSNKVILEPSAGKGDIVDYLHAHGAKEVIACELNRDLRKIVAQKCRIVGKDFLALTQIDVSHIDLIVMNPPFSKGLDHVLHAWNIAPPGCQIISLLNSDSAERYFSYGRGDENEGSEEDRQYVRQGKKGNELYYIIREHGEREYLGHVFNAAERKTECPIALIKLKKPGEATKDEFEGFFLDEEPTDPGQVGIMPYNFIRELVNRYIAAIKLFDEQLELGIRMNDLTSNFFDGEISFTCTRDKQPETREQYKKELQKAAWLWVLDKMKMEKYTTQGLKSDINKFVEQHTKIPFTMQNIYKMIEIVIGTTAGRMDKAIIEVFDYLTAHSEENRFHVEGWKTNSHYLIGKKFIMDWMVELKHRGGMGLRYNSNEEKINDLDKALCYVLGHNYDQHSTLRSLFNRMDKLEFGQWYCNGFFNVKGFKKGTMHFEFQNEDDWATFNQHIARIKGYPLFEHRTQTKYQQRNTGTAKKAA